ncbi:low-temperature-induced 65 kDa protein-like protein [Tanacetum coccineum]
MQKVKAKVDKLKGTIMHGHGHGHKDETEAVNNTPAVRSGLMEPTVMGTPVLAEDLYATHSDIVDPPVRSFSQWEEEEKHGDPPPVSTGLYGTRLFEDEKRHAAPAQPVSVGSHGTPASGKDEKREDTGVYVTHPGGPHVYADQDLNKENIPKGDVGRSSGMRVDPNAPGARTGYPANYGTEVTDPTYTGGHEAVGITDVLHSFHKMSVLDTPETESETKPFKSGKNEPSDQFSAKQVDNTPLDTIAADPSNKNSSYAQRITSATSAITGKAAAVKESIVGTLSPSGDNKSATKDYVHKVADTVTGTISPVYEKVVGAGSTVMSKMHGSGHDETTGSPGMTTLPTSKGSGVKEYLIESFKPGDDDKVLSETITNALHRKKANTQQETITIKPGDDDKQLPEVVKNALHKGKADTQQEVITTPEGETTIITTTTYGKCVINDDEGERRLQEN